MMQISSPQDGCLNASLSLGTSDLDIPEHLLEFTDGYTSKISADISQGFRAYDISGVCFEINEDQTGTFCYRMYAGPEDNLLQEHYFGYWARDLEVNINDWDEGSEINDWDEDSEYGYVDVDGSCYDDMGFELYCHQGIKGWGDFWMFEPATYEFVELYQPASICADPAECTGVE